MNEWEWQLLEDRTTPVDCVSVAGSEVRKGSRVRLRPRKGGDALDLMVAGRTARIASIEQDYEGNHHLAVVLDDDPGMDLGLLRQPGHRFFFSPDEVEPLTEDEAAPSAGVQAPTILVAGIGNIFLGDDGFGVEVAQRLAAWDVPAGVRVADFGIRGLDLAYALLDGADATILVDACARGGAPGTLYVIEPDLAALDDTGSAPAVIEAHGMNPMNVIRMAKALGGSLKRILLVGCEPVTLGPPEGQLGLSDSVNAAVNQAVLVVQKLVQEIRDGSWPGERPAISS